MSDLVNWNTAPTPVVNYDEIQLEAILASKSVTRLKAWCDSMASLNVSTWSQKHVRALLDFPAEDLFEATMAYLYAGTVESRVRSRSRLCCMMIEQHDTQSSETILELVLRLVEGGHLVVSRHFSTIDTFAVFSKEINVPLITWLFDHPDFQPRFWPGFFQTLIDAHRWDLARRFRRRLGPRPQGDSSIMHSVFYMNRMRRPLTEEDAMALWSVVMEEDIEFYARDETAAGFLTYRSVAEYVMNHPTNEQAKDILVRDLVLKRKKEVIDRHWDLIYSRVPANAFVPDIVSVLPYQTNFMIHLAERLVQDRPDAEFILPMWVHHFFDYEPNDKTFPVQNVLEILRLMQQESMISESLGLVEYFEHEFNISLRGQVYREFMGQNVKRWLTWNGKLEEQQEVETDI